MTAATRLNRVEAGDFIYSRLFAGRGAFGVISKELHGCCVSGEFPTYLPNEERLDLHFLRYWMWLPATISTVEEDCSGSTPLTRNRFKEEFFLALEIPLPPLAEQRRIVARIDELAAHIHEARTLRQQAEEEATALVTSINCHLAGGRTRKMGDILQLDEDVTPVVPVGSYPQVGVRSFGAGLFRKAAVAGEETTYRTFNRLYDGAIVLSQVKGWEGAVAVCPSQLEGWFVSPEYRTFRCITAESIPEYLSPLVRTQWFWERLQNATRGVGARRERTRPERFLEVEIPIPTVDQQRVGVALFAEVNALKRHKAEVVVGLNALLPSILDCAFQGSL